MPRLNPPNYRELKGRRATMAAIRGILRLGSFPFPIHRIISRLVHSWASFSNVCMCVCVSFSLWPCVRVCVFNTSTLVVCLCKLPTQFEPGTSHTRNLPDRWSPTAAGGERLLQHINRSQPPGAPVAKKCIKKSNTYKSNPWQSVVHSDCAHIPPSERNGGKI